MSKPRKLIRSKIVEYLKKDEWENEYNVAELNKLYALKIREELQEIQVSNHDDIMEFVDLIQVVYQFAKINGFTKEQIRDARIAKMAEKGWFGTTVLTNLNPNNPSNRIYFENTDRNE